MFFIIAFFASTTGCAGKTQITGNDISGTSEQVKPATMKAVDSSPSVVVDSSLVVCPVCKMKIHKSLDKSEYKGKREKRTISALLTVRRSSMRIRKST